jgi:hypothetical protein
VARDMRTKSNKEIEMMAREIAGSQAVYAKVTI